MKYDFLIVGAGLYGSTFARKATDLGKKCLVIDRRTHIAGNVYSESVGGIEVHKYGPHIFHTNSSRIWEFVNQFATFNGYRHKVLSNFDGELYSFPLNLNTLEKLWGISDDDALIKKLNGLKRESLKGDNLEDWAIAEVGEEIYYKFIYGYTKKQWGIEPTSLPSSIISRIPFRTTRDDQYHDAQFSGIPTIGYTAMVGNILDGIKVVVGEDYLTNREYWDSLADRIVYTGPIDEFFEYEYGQLSWRSLKFEQEEIDTATYQSVAQINYANESIPYTRIVEHKHFNPVESDKTVITREYPQVFSGNMEKFYPINDAVNGSLYLRYKSMIQNKFIFGGRLATYKYYDMDQVIASAIKASSKIKPKLR